MTNSKNEKTLDLRVTLQPIPFERIRDRGRPQVNPRIYLNLVAIERLKRQGFTEKQVRRAAFAQLRDMLGLDAKTVIVKAPDGDYFMAKTKQLDSNLIVTVSPAPEEVSQIARAA